MKRLAWLLLLPLASGALFGQTGYSITGTVPNGTVGVSYSASLQTNPQAYAAWSYTGSLPPGLNMTTGSSYVAAISGTPTTAGTYSFTVQANVGSNPNGAPIVVTASLHRCDRRRIRSARLHLSVESSRRHVRISIPAGSDSLRRIWPRNLHLLAGPASPGPLPPGLGILTTGPSTGEISGTPTQAGTFPFTVRATSQTFNNPPVYGTQTYSITITGSALTIVTTSLPAGTAGIAYSQALAATGGTPPYTWQWTGGKSAWRRDPGIFRNHLRHAQRRGLLHIPGQGFRFPAGECHRQFSPSGSPRPR